MDVNGILNVAAKDKGTGKAQNISIRSSNLSKDDIERMKTDAETFEEEDRKKREAAEARNEADSAAYGAERLVSENGGKMTAEEKEAIDSALKELRTALQGEDTQAMASAKEKLEKKVQEFSTRLYSQTPGGGESAAGSDEDGDTVDAEFSEQEGA